MTKKYVINSYTEYIKEAYKISDNFKKKDTFVYYFDSISNKYKVKITPYQKKPKYFWVGFGIIDNEFLEYDTTKIVNENPYQVMDTIISILSDFIKNNDVECFMFSFSGDKIKNNQRFLLYKKSIDKYLPSANLELIDGIYYLMMNK